MKKLLYVTLFLLTSCATPKNIVYFSDAERFAQQTVLQEYDNKIQKDDLLSITVSSKNPELAAPFNPATGTTTGGVLAGESGYLVNSNGDIVFPMLGKMAVVGLTHTALASVIEQRIVEEGFIKDPTVTVKLLNYKISVLGEVKQPGVKKIDTERITILDALGLAGDLTIYGQRENVSIIREQNGKREVASVDISNRELFNSPYYYLRPNDIIYVQPNKKQQRSSVGNPYLMSTLFSGTSLIVTLLNLIIK